MSSEKELQILKQYCKGRGLNIGCGPRAFPDAINIDMCLGAADIIADAAYLPCPSNHFNYVVSSHCLEHVEQAPLLVLREWLRVLKIGGRLAFVVPNGEHGWKALGEFPGQFVEGKHVHIFTEQILKDLVYYAGGEIEHLETIRREEWKTSTLLVVARKTGANSETLTIDSKRAYLMWLRAVGRNITIKGLLKWFVKKW
jgi:ubiquinone/menaquinone biosynthesis C-methylase UbiE